MASTRIMTVVYLPVLLFSASSCVVLSNPISDPYQADLDAALVGNWEAAEGVRWADRLVIEKYQANGDTAVELPPELLRVNRITLDKDGEPVDAGVCLLCFATRIADTRYLNAAIVTRESERALAKSGWDEDRLFYAVFRYRVEGDRLVLQLMDLCGTPEAERPRPVRDFGMGIARFFTLADSRRLVELLASRKCDKYFGEEIVFTRMEPQARPLAAR